MNFKIIALKDDLEQIYFYDNEKNILSREDGFVFEYPTRHSFEQKYTKFSPEIPLKKSRDITVLKIQMGLSCNYSCEYCSQRFVERSEETTKDDIFLFMKRLNNLNFDEKSGLKIEFWGGEPFVYWKTLKPLVEALKEKFFSWKIKPKFSIITNGSLLTPEINSWFLENIDGGAISHDGPGQWVRGPDPFSDPEKKKLALELYSSMKGKLSFNSMLNAKNTSRLKIFEWFKEFIGDSADFIILGEGGVVDAYDEGGIDLSFNTKQEHFDFRKQAFSDIIVSGGKFGFSGITAKIDAFTNDLLHHKPSDALTQKCGMDLSGVISVDLKGNVITCQNVSASAINSNGQPHFSGNITDMDNVAITTSTHWSEREGCKNCPVLHLCKGACMFVTGDYWYHSCANSYSDYISLFAVSFFNVTGSIPVYIENDILPPERRDIWGTTLTYDDI